MFRRDSQQAGVFVDDDEFAIFVNDFESASRSLSRLRGIAAVGFVPHIDAISGFQSIASVWQQLGVERHAVEIEESGDERFGSPDQFLDEPIGACAQMRRGGIDGCLACQKGHECDLEKGAEGRGAAARVSPLAPQP